MTAKPPFLTIVETAEYLGTTERFIRRLIAERRIGFIKLGRPIRIPMSAIEEFLQGGSVQPRNRRVS
jgi:excisionase family DNA binding protein